MRSAVAIGAVASHDVCRLSQGETENGSLAAGAD
jgi:hypothetical protein